MAAAAHGLLSSDGVPVSVIHDSPGFVVQRVLAQIVNIACDIAQQRIASPADIDAAVTLGPPSQPLAWAARSGREVLDSRRPAGLLRRSHTAPPQRSVGALGVSLLTRSAVGHP
jgi:3-hydroxybutyryl-CoA dehydrogenase